MAVTGLAKELADERSKEERADGGRSYKRRYMVTTDSVSDDGNVALTAPGLPQRFYYYITATSNDTLARVTERTATQTRESPFKWLVEVTYDTVFRDQREEEQNPTSNPLLDLPDIEWSYETIQVPIVGTPDQNVSILGSTAVYSGAIKTPAGEIINPPPMMDESRPVCTISRNELEYNAMTACLYHNAINSDYIFGSIPPRCAKMRGISARLMSERDKTFWRVTYTIAFKRDTWLLQLLNWGSVYLAAATDTSPTQFKTTDGFPTFGFLSTDGTARASTLTPTFSTYRIQKELPFSSLNLPLGVNR